MGTRAFLASLVIHSALAAALGVVPLFSDEALPERALADVVGPVLSLPPPPPPPPALGVVRARRTTEPRKVDPDLGLVPPTAIPEAIEASDTGPIDEAYRSDVIGDSDGSRDGVVGSLMGDLPTSAPPPPSRVVRINGGLLAPRLVHRVDPVYPPLAAAAHVTASVVLEAEVDAHGQVARASVVHGHPLFDEAAIEAVRQWRYQPLLLSGEPTAFILTVTIRFELKH